MLISVYTEYPYLVLILESSKRLVLRFFKYYYYDISLSIKECILYFYVRAFFKTTLIYIDFSN